MGTSPLVVTPIQFVADNMLPEGHVAIPFTVDFTSTNAVEIDLSNYISLRQISCIKGIFLSWSGATPSDVVKMVVSGTNQTLVIGGDGASSQFNAYLPIFSNMPAKFVFSKVGGTFGGVLQAQAYNFEVDPIAWTPGVFTDQGVQSFNGRLGAVVPVPSDYRPAFIGAADPNASNEFVSPQRISSFSPPLTHIDLEMVSSGAVGGVRLEGRAANVLSPLNATSGEMQFFVDGIDPTSTVVMGAGDKALVSAVPITVPKLLSSGAAQSIAPGAGAGTGATATISGTDVSGFISLTTGSAGQTVNSVVAAITFHLPFALSPNILLMPASASAAGATNAVWVSASTTQFFVNTTTAFPINTTFTWCYMVVR